MVSIAALQDTRGRRVETKPTLSSPPQLPPFPTVMTMAMLFVDYVIGIIVFVATIILLPFGWLLGIAVGICASCVIGIWLFMKTGSTHRSIKQRGALYLVISFIIEIIPVLRFLVPQYALTVVLTHLHERKRVMKLIKEQNIKDL
jgi:hypothetical protein